MYSVHTVNYGNCKKGGSFSMSELNENNQNNNQNTNQNTNQNNGDPCCDPYPDYNPRADYNNGQYLSPQSGYNNGQYYDPQPGSNSGQYYNPQAGYDNGQYYNPQAGSNGGQYYNPQPGYDNGQYYDPQAGYNNGQYYGPQSGYNNGQYYGPRSGYGNGQYYNPSPYQNPQAAYQQAQPVRQPVSNVFYYILMALTAVSAILTIAATISMIRAAVDGSLFSSLTPGQDYASLYAILLDAFANSPTFSMYSMLNYVLRMAILVVSILDIVQVRRNGYPILGLVLFTIFLKPGYFLWRAYAAKQKKLLPALFTVFYILLYVGYFFWCVSYFMRLA